MRVALDSVIFIYAAQDEGELGDKARRLLNRMVNGEINGIASTLCLAEVLAKPMAKSIEQGHETQADMESFPHLDYIPVDEEVAIRSAQLRGQHGLKLRLADSIHLASAIVGKATLFVTNDHVLAKLNVEGFKIKLISEV